MSLENFIPEVWSARLLANLSKVQVYTAPAVINSDYEGEISGVGDSVRINAIGRVTVSDYSKNTDIAAPVALQDGQTILSINKAKYFNFQIDDIDKAQQKPKVMDSAMAEAAYALRDAADHIVAAQYTDVPAANLIGTDGSPKTGYTTANIYEFLVDAGAILDDNNVPSEGRWAIVPPWFHGYLLKDARFVGYGTQAQIETLQNGRVGRAANFDIYKSNNVPNTTATKYKIICGHPVAWTFAQQLLEMNAYRPEKRFADAVKGLHVYGTKVVRPEALAVITANKT